MLSINDDDATTHQKHEMAVSSPISSPLRSSHSERNIELPELSLLVPAHKDYQQIIESEALLKRLAPYASLPARFTLKSETTVALAFSNSLAITGSFFYVAGSARFGLMSQIGGVSSNYVQNEGYTRAAYYFYRHASRKDLPILVTATLLALLANTPTTIGAYKVSESVVIAALTFAGNFPQVIYGMKCFLDGIYKKFYDNSAARDFLREKMQDMFAEYPDYIQALEKPRSVRILRAVIVMGILLMPVGAFSQTGYVCGASNFLADLTQDEIIGISLGVFTNLPGISIAIGPAGFGVGEKLITKADDFYDFITTSEPLRMSAREKLFSLSMLTAISIFTFWSYFSSGASKELYEDQCNLSPVIGNFFDNFLHADVDYGAIFYNTVMASMIACANLYFFKVAYSTKPENNLKVVVDAEAARVIEIPSEKDAQKYHLAAMDCYRKNGPLAEIEAIATQVYPDEVRKWQRPARVSICRRLNFFKNTVPVAQEDYQVLAENQHSPRRI